MSGISAKNMPRILSNFFYKPGQKISKNPNWEDRIKLIVRNAPKWDVGILAGVPAWAQIVLEEIIKTYKLKNIHEMWPNLSVYIHGGVAFEPYRENFNKLLGKPLIYIETYMASEGSFGFKARPDAKGIKLVLNADIFYEFVPFNRNNFTENGDLLPNAETIFIHEVKEEEEYAILLSTCAGAWRYLIGDVVRFTNAKEHEIVITGRTKHFLSLVGEHLSVDNMNKAINIVSDELNISIGEFTVAGIPYGNFFAHHWFIATDDSVNSETLKAMIDQKLKELNDDYEVERRHALKEIFVDVLSEDTFMNFMRSKGKVGGQHKFPRVLKGKILEEWMKFLQEEKVRL
jgi:hypothetical protein